MQQSNRTYKVVRLAAVLEALVAFVDVAFVDAVLALAVVALAGVLRALGL